MLSPDTLRINKSLFLGMKFKEIGNVSSIFSTANIGIPAVTLPTIGILTISLIIIGSFKISIVLGLVESLLISPFFSNFDKWLCTDEVELSPTPLQISLTEGGYPFCTI